MKKNKKWLGSKKAIKVKSSRLGTMGRNRPDRKMTIHNEGVDRPGSAGSVKGVAEYVRSKGIEYHLIWNSHTGEFAQLLPFDSAARSLMNGGIDGGIGCNRSGAVNIQVCVVSYGNRPFTGGPMKGAEVLGDICDAWGIPHKLRNPNSGRSLAKWHQSGITYHRVAPGNDHTDPGNIDVKKLKKAMWPKDAKKRKKK